MGQTLTIKENGDAEIVTSSAFQRECESEGRAGKVCNVDAELTLVLQDTYRLGQQTKPN